MLQGFWFTRRMASPVKVVITGFEGCGWYLRAANAGANLAATHPEVQVETICLPRPQFKLALHQWRKGLGDRAQTHETSPFVWQEVNGVKTFIGGHDDFVAFTENY